MSHKFLKKKPLEADKCENLQFNVVDLIAGNIIMTLINNAVQDNT